MTVIYKKYTLCTWLPLWHNFNRIYMLSVLSQKKTVDLTAWKEICNFIEYFSCLWMNCSFSGGLWKLTRWYRKWSCGSYPFWNLNQNTLTTPKYPSYNPLNSAVLPVGLCILRKVHDLLFKLEVWSTCNFSRIGIQLKFFKWMLETNSNYSWWD